MISQHLRLIARVKLNASPASESREIVLIACTCTQSVHVISFNLNRHSWGLLGPQRDASVIFLESVHIKIPVFLLFLTHIIVVHRPGLM